MDAIFKAVLISLWNNVSLYPAIPFFDFFFLQKTRKQEDAREKFEIRKLQQPSLVHGPPPRKPTPSLTPQQVAVWSPKAAVRFVFPESKR